MSWHKEIFEVSVEPHIDSFYKTSWGTRARCFKLMKDMQIDLTTMFVLECIRLIDNEPKKKRFLTKENI
jgi:hypothetical protein